MRMDLVGPLKLMDAGRLQCPVAPEEFDFARAMGFAHFIDDEKNSCPTTSQSCITATSTTRNRLVNIAGIICHERWCMTLSPVVHDACEIVLYPDKLTIGDAIILHSLGVAWSNARS